MRTAEEIIAAREKTHGDFGEVAEIEQMFELVVRERVKDGRRRQSWFRLKAGERYALQMIFGKVARVISSGNASPDHAEDIAGYARLLYKQRHGEIDDLPPGVREAVDEYAARRGVDGPR